MKRVALNIILSLAALGVLYHFFSSDITQFFDTGSAVTSHTGSESRVQQVDLDNEYASAVVQRSHKRQVEVIVGCMKTDAACRCYSRDGKIVPTTAQQCVSYLKDGSGHDNKLTLQQ